MPNTPDPQTAKAEALLLRFAAEAHRRKWSYDRGLDDDGVPIKSEAFDALHRLGEEMRTALEELRRTPAVVPSAAETTTRATSDAVREQLLAALDFSYCQTVGYDTPEALLAAYDATQSVPPPADRAALRDRIADTVMPFLLNFSDEESARINAAEVADALLADVPAPAPVCICGHPERQHFEDACITEITGCNCGDYLEPQDAAEAIDRWRQAALQARAADRATRRDRIAALFRNPPGAARLGDATPGEIADAVLAVLPEQTDRAAEAERPLSPDYEHPECGFHWHGRDDMDIPMRDGQPVCPRCELAAVEKQLHYSEKRREELRQESRRRGKLKGEYAERIRQLEIQLDEVRSQLGAEILRAGQAEAELRRVAAEEQPAETHSCRNCEDIDPDTCLMNPERPS